MWCLSVCEYCPCHLLLWSLMRIAEDIRTLAHCSRVHQNWHMLPCHCIGPRYGRELHATREGHRISAFYSSALERRECARRRMASSSSASSSSHPQHKLSVQIYSRPGGRRLAFSTGNGNGTNAIYRLVGKKENRSQIFEDSR